MPGSEVSADLKVKILASLLIVSALLNVAGLVFFICFLNLRGHYKEVSRERNIMAHNLSVIHGAGVLSDVLSSDHVYKRTFRSHYDGDEDVFGMIPPSTQPPARNLTLVVYLHGMGSSYLEPFVVPENRPIADAVTHKFPSVVFISSSYRKEASWGNPPAMADITQNIREVCQELPIQKIVLVGTSMGGCTVLTYAAIAPTDIKDKIAGVVSVESAGDLAKLYKLSRHPAIRPALVQAVGGAPEQAAEAFRQMSLMGNIDGLRQSVRVAVISAKDDDIVPPQLQKDIVEALEQRNVPVKLIEIDGGHGAPPAPVYLQGMDFVLGKSAAS